MSRLKIVLLSVAIFGCLILTAQPEPCDPTNPMSSFCADACVVCDIDGFTGINNLTAQGQPFGEFCTTSYDNMQYISFIAGSVDLTVTVDVSNCVGGFNSLEVGFFYSEDCENFEAISICDTDIQSGESQTFSNNQPLVIGQYYYLIMDGSFGANCNWTFNVIEGTTEVLPLTTSGDLDIPDEVCPNELISINTTVETGAAIFDWYINGTIQSGSAPNIDVSFVTEGMYEICVIASNVCDEAPPSCKIVTVRTPGTTEINEMICDGQCVDINGISYCDEGTFIDLIPLPIGCDSTLVIDITLLPNPEVSIDVWICDGDAFDIGTTEYTQTGIYQETILTAMNCDSVVNLDLLVIQCEIEGSVDSIPAICYGTSTGSIVFNIDQGTPPFMYTYTLITDPSITGTGSTSVLVDNVIPNLPIGIYQIYIEDNFSNDVVLLSEVTEPPLLELNLLPSDYNGFNVSCFNSNGNPGSDGSIYADVVGGVGPYIFDWDNGQSDQEIINLAAQEYSVTVTDTYGCPIEDVITLNAPPELDAMFLFMNPECEGFDSGFIEVSSTDGGVPDYVYSLDGNEFQESNIFEGLIQGTYTVYVQDSNGCTISETDVLVAPDIPEVDLGADITIALGDSIQLVPLLNNSSISNIEWMDSLTLSCGNCLSPYAIPFDNTTYTLTVFSEDDCSDNDQISITVEKRRRVYIPNIYSPNGDGLNDFLTVYAGPEADVVELFSIYDRWGELIFEAKEFSPNSELDGWKGTFKNKELNPGVFSYHARVHFIDDVVLDYAGEVTLNR